jgi:hypothetical protein
LLGPLPLRARGPARGAECSLVRDRFEPGRIRIARGSVGRASPSPAPGCGSLLRSHTRSRVCSGRSRRTAPARKKPRPPQPIPRTCSWILLARRSKPRLTCSIEGRGGTLERQHYRALGRFPPQPDPATSRMHTGRASPKP